MDQRHCGDRRHASATVRRVSEAPEVRTGCEVIHTLPAGASIRMLDATHYPRLAVITHPERVPYFLHTDGTTEDIEL